MALAEGMEVVEEEEGTAGRWQCEDSDALMAASIWASSLASTMLLTWKPNNRIIHCFIGAQPEKLTRKLYTTSLQHSLKNQHLYKNSFEHSLKNQQLYKI